MNFTDGMFEFPTRIYDRASSIKLQKNEDIGIDNVGDADWTEGTAAIPLDEIKGFIDYIPRGRLVADVDQDGWECCVIITNTMGEYLCNVPLRVVKNRVNSFFLTYTDNLNKMVEENMKAKQASIPTPKKKRWWKLGK